MTATGAPPGTTVRTRLDIASALEHAAADRRAGRRHRGGARPLLVVAGAGSGKTETMAARVVWLVANRLVEPDQVLGLTFTRKAATELVAAHRQAAARPRARVGSGPRPPTTARAPRCWAAPRPSRPTTRMPVGSSASTPCGWASSPSSASSPRPGRGSWRPRPCRAGTARWTTSSRARRRSSRPSWRSPVRWPSTCAPRPRSWSTSTPCSRGSTGCPTARARGRSVATREAVTVLRERRTRAADRRGLPRPQARAGVARLRRPDGDRRHGSRGRCRPSARSSASASAPCCSTSSRTPRRRSSSCCGRCFHHPGVALTAVGDPNQSIYGWRGASATTLLRFPTEFAGDRTVAGRRAAALRRAGATTCLILDAANAVAAPLATAHVQPLRPRPGAGRGSIDVPVSRPPRTRPTTSRRGSRPGGSARAVGAPGAAPPCCAGDASSFPLVLEALRRSPACPSRSSGSAACSSLPR